MIRKVPLILLVWLGIFGFVSPAQTLPDISGVDEIVDRASGELQTDLELVVLRHGKVVYRRATNNFGGVGSLEIASASKWLSAAVMQSMVDEGRFSWDDPAGLHLHYMRDDKAEITLRQLFSHTSGIGLDFPCLSERKRTMDSCAESIAAAPLLNVPGTAFHYGEASMQVGGRAAERISVKFWEDLFQERIARPLGMTSTSFQAAVATANPLVGAGASSVVDDYARFVQMIAAGGELNGVRVLSRHGVNLMLADQTRGTRIDSTLYSRDELLRPGASENRYGLGSWLEGISDGVRDANSSQGSFGVSPYVDRRRGIAFVAFLRASAFGFNRYYYEIQDALNAAFPLPPLVRSAAFETLPLAERTDVPAEEESAGTRLTHRYVPQACQETGSACPGMVVLHPDGSNGIAFAEEAGLVDLAEREGIVIEAPDGLPATGMWGDPAEAPDHQSARYWNRTPDFGMELANDSGWPRILRDRLAEVPGVDSTRISLLGFREGADVAALAACGDAGSFAGMVLVEPGVRLKDDGVDSPTERVCQPATTMPVMVWSRPGVADAGGSVDFSASQVQFWAERNRCKETTHRRFHGDGYSFDVSDSTGCRASAMVRLVHAANGADAWIAGAGAVSWEFLRGLERGALRPTGVEQTNAASYLRRTTACGALASLFGQNLAPHIASATGESLPTELAGVRVQVRDKLGSTRDASLVFVSPTQINLLVPEGLAPGMASVFVYRGQDLSHSDWLYLEESAAGLFAADATGQGPAAGEVLYVYADGTRASDALAFTTPGDDGGFHYSATPVLVGAEDVKVYLILYGTGWRHAAPGSVDVQLGDLSIIPDYAGSQGSFAGLDQVNVRIDLALPEGVGVGVTSIVPIAIRTAAGASNRLQLLLQYGEPLKR